MRARQLLGGRAALLAAAALDLPSRAAGAGIVASGSRHRSSDRMARLPPPPVGNPPVADRRAQVNRPVSQQQRERRRPSIKRYFTARLPRLPVSTRRWGTLTKRRLVLANQTEVDFGVARASWASARPLDPGTARVARDGLIALHDRDGLLGDVVAAAT